MKPARKCVGACGLLVTLCLIQTPGVDGQSGRRLEGRVTDFPGLDVREAGIAGATVTLLADDRVQTAVTDQSGEFVFTDLTAATRYVEASSGGYFSASMPITDATPERVLVNLEVWSCSGGCPLAYDVRDRSIHYEQRRDRAQLAGAIAEFSGPLLANVSLTLRKGDLSAGEGKWPAAPYRPPSMRDREFRYVNVAQTVSNSKGEFQFAGLEPGWYSLDAEKSGFYSEKLKFWIARETLTRPSRIEMLRTGPGQPSPYRLPVAVPSIDITPTVETPSAMELLPLKTPSK
jgi:hypothetical protein